MDCWGTLGKVSGIKATETKHTVTSLDFFDCLQTSGIIRPTGEIKKCLDEYVGKKHIHTHIGHIEN